LLIVEGRGINAKYGIVGTDHILMYRCRRLSLNTGEHVARTVLRLFFGSRGPKGQVGHARPVRFAKAPSGPFTLAVAQTKVAP